MKISIIGAGISGLSIGQLLNDKHDITIIEGSDRPGGLIKCDRIEGSLFHRTGGHVFNTKRKDVLDWFWTFFDKENEFIKAERNAVVNLSPDKNIPYPIENHVYHLSEEIQQHFISDLIAIARKENIEPKNFEEFLINRFGNTLYELYFKPYNYKVWRRDLTQVPLSWLEGKLPMPTVQEMIYNNMNHIEEKQFVHSTFFYPINDGSQFLVDRLAKGLNIRYNTIVNSIERKGRKWLVNNEEVDKVIFCGNVKQLPQILSQYEGIKKYSKQIEDLEYHGTTTVFCEIERNPYSWIYLPSLNYVCHRIICTGNFAPSNNAKDKMTSTVEFTDEISIETIKNNLDKIPLKPRYLTHHYEKYTYPIQNKSTRNMISQLKQELANDDFYLLGRFAEWEYYNMDAAIGAAMDIMYSF